MTILYMVLGVSLFSIIIYGMTVAVQKTFEPESECLNTTKMPYRVLNTIFTLLICSRMFLKAVPLWLNLLTLLLGLVIYFLGRMKNLQ